MSDACCGADGAVGPPPAQLRDVPEIRAAGLAGMALAAGFATGWAGVDILSQALFVVGLGIGGSTFVPQAVRGLWRRRLSVGTLMAIAAIGAVLLGELGEAATLAFLFSISEALESYALARTRQGLRALLDMVPPQATVLIDGRSTILATADLRPGDLLLVRPGERVATDGIIRRGRSALDFSTITGESLAVERGPGDEVYAAAINGSAAIEVDVSASTADNSLARIVAIVEQAQERKGASQRLASASPAHWFPGCWWWQPWWLSPDRSWGIPA